MTESFATYDEATTAKSLEYNRENHLPPSPPPSPPVPDAINIVHLNKKIRRRL